MNDIPTPRTDAYKEELFKTSVLDAYSFIAHEPEFKRLERELATALAKLAATQEELKQARCYHSGTCDEYQGNGRCNCWITSVGATDAEKYDTLVRDLRAKLAECEKDRDKTKQLAVELAAQDSNTIAAIRSEIERKDAKIAILDTALRMSEPFTQVDFPRGPASEAWVKQQAAMTIALSPEGVAAQTNPTQPWREVVEALVEAVNRVNGCIESIEPEEFDSACSALTEARKAAEALLRKGEVRG